MASFLPTHDCSTANWPVGTSHLVWAEEQMTWAVLCVCVCVAGSRALRHGGGGEKEGVGGGGDIWRSRP